MKMKENRIIFYRHTPWWIILVLFSCFCLIIIQCTGKEVLVGFLFTLIMLYVIGKRLGENLNILPKKVLIAFDEHEIALTGFFSSFFPTAKVLFWQDIKEISVDTRYKSRQLKLLTFIIPGSRHYLGPVFKFKLSHRTWCWWHDNTIKILARELDVSPEELFAHLKKYYNGPMHNYRR